MSLEFRKKPLFVFLLAALLAACSEEYLDMSTAFRSDLCVVGSRPGQPVHLLSDKGYVLNPTPGLDSAHYKPGSRFLVTYIVVDSSLATSSNQVAGYYSVRVKDMQAVLVKPVLKNDDPGQPITGNEPVNVLSQPWLGGGYLNMELMLKYEDDAIKHSLWMVLDSAVVENGSLNTHLTILHNANGDGQTKTASTLVSFDCANLPAGGASDSLIIRVKEWDADNRLVQKQYRLLNFDKKRLTVVHASLGIH